MYPKFLRRIYNPSLTKWKKKNIQITDPLSLDSAHPELLEIGYNCILAPGCKILTHDDSPKIRGERTKVARTVIGNGCFIGCNAIILAGVTLGDYTIVGAGAVVTKSFPAYSILVGNPARKLRKV